jgi:hypothetical protein
MQWQAIRDELDDQQRQMDAVHTRPSSTEERAYRAQRFGN